jgi:hypothetical protein
LKKCPGCGSIDSDEDYKCGVCGTTLLDVQSTDESLEQAELETNLKEKADDQRLGREQRRRLHRGAITGFLTGLTLTLLGGWLFVPAIVGGATAHPVAFFVGLLMLILGILSVESVLGLYEGAPYHGQPWTAWIAMRADREEKEREKEEESD